MGRPATPESMLVADCGAVATKVGLVDRVGSEYRLVGVARSRTMVDTPGGDITAGIRRAVGQLESLTGRVLLSPDGELLRPEQSNGDGVDAVVAVTSAALPLRTALVGLSRDLSVAAAQRALASSPAVVEHCIAVDEESGRWGTTARDGRAGGPSASVEKLAASQPDLIVMVGGVDGGALTPLLEMASIVGSIGAAMDQSARPMVLFAGNREARARVAERIGSVLEFRSVDNVQPALDRENTRPLQNEIDVIYSERRVDRLPGIDKLAAWTGARIKPSIAGLERVAQFLARRYDLRVDALDIGGASTTHLHTDGTNIQRALLPDIGLGYGLDAMIERVGMERIARWLPGSISLEQAHACLLNQALRPWTTPMRAADRAVLNAAAREAVLLALAGHLRSPDGTRSDLIVLGGAPLARGGKPNGLMLLAVDTLDRRGVFTVAADLTGILPALGALAAVNPEAAAQVLEKDGLVTLGTALVANTPGRAAGTTAIQASLQSRSGARLDASVAAGAVELIPLGVGEKSEVDLQPARGADLGIDGRRGAVKREMEGGTVGLLIDARGRPLPLTGSLELQRKQTQEWLTEAGAW